MNARDLRRLIRDNAGNTTFSVAFTKRTTGELRVMNCRLGVKSALKGGDLKYDPAKRNLLTVYDMIKHGYRSIPLDAVDWIKLKGRVWYGPAHVE